MHAPCASCGPARRAKTVLKCQGRSRFVVFVVDWRSFPCPRGLPARFSIPVMLLAEMASLGYPRDGADGLYGAHSASRVDWRSLQIQSRSVPVTAAMPWTPVGGLPATCMGPYTGAAGGLDQPATARGGDARFQGFPEASPPVSGPLRFPQPLRAVPSMLKRKFSDSTSAASYDGDSTGSVTPPFPDSDASTAGAVAQASARAPAVPSRVIGTAAHGAHIAPVATAGDGQPDRKRGPTTFTLARSNAAPCARPAQPVPAPPAAPQPSLPAPMLAGYDASGAGMMQAIPTTSTALQTFGGASQPMALPQYAVTPSFPAPSAPPGYGYPYNFQQSMMPREYSSFSGGGAWPGGYGMYPVQQMFAAGAHMQFAAGVGYPGFGGYPQQLTADALPGHGTGPQAGEFPLASPESAASGEQQETVQLDSVGRVIKPRRCAKCRQLRRGHVCPFKPVC